MLFLGSRGRRLNSLEAGGDPGLTGVQPKFGLGDIFSRFPKIQYIFIG